MMVKNKHIGKTLLALTVLGASCLSTYALAATQDTISVAITANKASPVGKAIFQGAQLAASEINAAGGINGQQLKLDEYDTHASSTEAVNGFQRAVQHEHDVAVVGSYISEVALALAPWAARLKTPYLTTAAASDEISKAIQKHPKRYKYVFQATFNSTSWAKSVCGYARDLLVNDLGYASAVVVSEDAAWTRPMVAEYKKCLPKAGLKVTDFIKFSPDTRNFSPIFSKAQKGNPDVMLVDLSHTGVKPTVQWKQKEVPLLMAGMHVQAQSGTFWDSTHGATEGVITAALGAGAAATAPKTKHFYQSYVKQFGVDPVFDAYTTYDAIYMLKEAIEQKSSTDADAIVDALSSIKYNGTTGTIAFHGLDSPLAHAMKYGKDFVSGVALQWQDGKQVVVWPADIASGKTIFPDFVPAPQGK